MPYFSDTNVSYLTDFTKRLVARLLTNAYLIDYLRVNYDGLMTVLKYIYGGTASVKSDVPAIW